jgi:hypothetical protein
MMNELTTNSNGYVVAFQFNGTQSHVVTNGPQPISYFLYYNRVLSKSEIAEVEQSLIQRYHPAPVWHPHYIGLVAAVLMYVFLVIATRRTKPKHHPIAFR